MRDGLGQQRADVVVVERVDHLPAVALADDEPEVPKHPQLLGDRRLRHPEVAREIADRAGAGAKAAEDPHAARRRERLHRLRDRARRRRRKERQIRFCRHESCTHHCMHSRDTVPHPARCDSFALGRIMMRLWPLPRSPTLYRGEHVQITRHSPAPHPAERLVHRNVYVDTVATRAPPARVGAEQRALHAGRAHRMAHPPVRPDDLCHRGHWARQRRGGPVEAIRPGDRVYFEPGEQHWHGAAPTAS